MIRNNDLKIYNLIEDTNENRTELSLVWTLGFDELDNDDN